MIVQFQAFHTAIHTAAMSYLYQIEMVPVPIVDLNKQAH